VSCRGSRTTLLRAPLLIAVALATTFYAEIWQSQTNFLRACAEPALLGMLVLLDAPQPPLPQLLAATAIFGGANVAIWTGVGRF